MPAYLETLVVPRARIAEVLTVNRIHRTRQIDDLVRLVAWHEAGHGVAWALNGGTLEQTTIVPDGNEHCVQWGLTTYDVPDEPSTEERLRLAFSGMGGAAICELAGDPDIDGTMEDFQSSVENLRFIYPHPDELCTKSFRRGLRS